MPSLRALIAALLASTLAACAAPKPLLGPVPPTAMGDAIEVQQRITLRSPERTYAMQAALRADPQGTTLIGLGPGGQRAFSLQWAQTIQRWETFSEVVEALDPAWLVADLQLAFWPLADLREALSARFEILEHGCSRLVWEDGELVWWSGRDGDDPWSSRTLAYNARLGYRLSVESRRLEGASAP